LQYNAKRAGDSHSIVEVVMRLQALLALAVGFLIAADDSNDAAAKKDLERFQGNWTLISLEREPSQDAKPVSDNE
jgi:hypothetical protein